MLELLGKSITIDVLFLDWFEWICKVGITKVFELDFLFFKISDKEF